MKTLILPCMFAFLTFQSIAQIHFGINGGINRNAFHRTSIHDFKAYAPYFSSSGKIGWQLGFFSKAKLTDHWSLIPEVRFVKRGTAESSGAEQVTTTHIELPLSVQYGITEFLAGNVGGVYSYTLSGDIGEWESDEVFKPNTFAIQAGLALRCSNRLSLNATYYRGLKPVLVQTYNTSFQLALHIDLFKI
jgi:hypothetical protein